MSIWVDHEEGSKYVSVDARFGPTLKSKEKHANQTTLTLVDPLDCCSILETRFSLFFFFFFCIN